MARPVRENAPTLAVDQAGYRMPIASPGGAPQEVGFNNSAGDAVASNAFTSTVIRIVATAACFYKIGPDVDSSANAATADGNDSHYLPANAPYDWEVTPGDKISVIDADASSAAAGEVLYITELT
jgi:hypothetical protein